MQLSHKAIRHVVEKDPDRSGPRARTRARYLATLNYYYTTSLLFSFLKTYLLNFCMRCFFEEETTNARSCYKLNYVSYRGVERVFVLVCAFTHMGTNTGTNISIDDENMGRFFFFEGLAFLSDSVLASACCEDRRSLRHPRSIGSSMPKVTTIVQDGVKYHRMPDGLVECTGSGEDCQLCNQGREYDIKAWIAKHNQLCLLCDERPPCYMCLRQKCIEWGRDRVRVAELGSYHGCAKSRFNSYCEDFECKHGFVGWWDSRWEAIFTEKRQAITSKLIDAREAREKS